MRHGWYITAAMGIVASALLIAGCGDSQTPPPASTSASARLASEGTMIPLTVRNATDTPVTLKVIKTDNHDWTSPRPDWTRDGTPEHPDEKGGFQGTVLAPGQADTRVLGTNPSGTVFFEFEFIVAGDQDPPVVRLQRMVTGSVPGKRSPKRGASNVAVGWASSDSDSRTCNAVTKSFPQDKIKVTIECDPPEGPSLVKIEKL
jgi:hypothetical protein